MISLRGTILVILLVAVFSIATGPPGRSVAQSGVQLGPFIATYKTANVTDPTLAPNQPGDEINVTVTASNLPDIISSSAGGLQGFDISLNYSTAVYQVQRYDYNGPNCSRDDNCLYTNATQSNSLVLNSTVDSSHGIVHLAMVVLDPGLRAHGSGVLFKVTFQIIGRGKSHFAIMPSSQLYGYSNNCGAFLDYTSTSAWLDNRRPYQITADPPPNPIPTGMKFSVQITVSKVNAAGDGYVTLILSHWTQDPSANYSFTPRTDKLSSTEKILSFSSTLTLYTPLTTPPGTYQPEIIAHLNTTFEASYEARLVYPVTVGTTYALSSSPAASPVQNNPVSSLSFDAPSQTNLPLLASFTYVTGLAGIPVLLTPTVCGGTSPYGLHWGFGDGSFNSTSLDTAGVGGSTSHLYKSTGQFTVRLNVSDASGKTFNVANTLSVTGVSPAPSLSLGILQTILLAAIVSILFLGSLLYIRRRRRSAKLSAKESSQVGMLSTPK